ncbi:hypothetical protein IQ252_03950 [Tychonema sp. LEGE 07203]|nr:hypothetical protein [Tychonema sp. LEGE 07203]
MSRRDRSLFFTQAIALRTTIAVFGIWCAGISLFHFRRSVIGNNKGISLLMRDGRSHQAEKIEGVVLA